MSNQPIPYIQRKAGDPWTVEDFHDLQTKVQEDISGSIETAIQQLDRVDKAGDSDKFGGKNPDEYAKAIIDRVLAELPKRTGYMMLFKVLETGEESVVEHKLGAFPLVDVYQLDYFRVIASEDDHVYETFTTFYLYHSSEENIRFRPEESSARATSLAIDPEDGHAYRIPFQRMLELFEVQYDDESSLGDVEAEFWNAFLTDPNDKFDDDQYCHSPWLDRHCREIRTVGWLKGRREWDNIYFQVRPRKTINYENGVVTVPDDEAINWTPNNIQVVHFNLNTLGLVLLQKPDLPVSQTGAEDKPPQSYNPDFGTIDPIKDDHLKVMVLIKV